MIKNTEKDDRSIQMVILMRDSSRAVSIMDLENILGQTVELIKVNFKMILPMEKENIPMQLVTQ